MYVKTLGIMREPTILGQSMGAIVLLFEPNEANNTKRVDVLHERTLSRE